jgi:hypothetical protein
MPVDCAQIDRPARAAARTEDVEPRRPGAAAAGFGGAPPDGEKVYCLSQWVPFDHSIE